MLAMHLIKNDLFLKLFKMTKNRPSQNEPLHTEMALPRQLYVTSLGAMCLSGSCTGVETFGWKYHIYIIYHVTLS